MKTSKGIVLITPDGHYVAEGSLNTHGGAKPHYFAVVDLSSATLFFPAQARRLTAELVNVASQGKPNDWVKLTGVNAYATRVVLLGDPIEESSNEN